MGEVGFPITLYGMVVHPGDLILGDIDGVLTVPRLSVERILESARSKNEAEGRQKEATRKGTVDRTWVDKALIDKGCEFVD